MTQPPIPVILTCEADLAVMQRFVESFANVRQALAACVVLIDMSRSPHLSGSYLALIASLDPVAVYIHPAEAGISVYDSVQVAANLALEYGLRHAADDQPILFLEDDIVFSSQFSENLATAELGSETGFLTLYQPGDGYGRNVIDPNGFYGTQCVLFTRKAATEIVSGRDEMMANFWPGYDIRWSRFLAHKGYTLYCADHSYVQHSPAHSRLHDSSSHVSNCYMP